VRVTLPIAVLASVAGLIACGDEEPVATTAPRPACVPRDDRHQRICGLAPPSRRVEGGTAYKLTPVLGDSFWVVLPDDFPAGAVAVPAVPLAVNAGLTTAGARAAAEQSCAGFPRCEAIVVDRDGALTRWDDASGSIRDLEVTTVDLGGWTLVMLEPDAARAARIAGALRWHLDEDRYPRVTGAVETGSAGVWLWVADVLIDVVPGCDSGPELQRHPPDTVAGGRWCEDGRSVDVSFASRPRLDRLHEALRILATPPPAP
jgi:hypothetical protein